MILVADGIRPDTLAAAMIAGEIPALAKMSAEGGTAHCYISVSVGNRSGVHAVHHGALPGPGRPPRHPLVRSRGKRDLPAAAGAQLRRQRVPEGRPRHRPTRADAVRTLRFQYRRAQRDRPRPASRATAKVTRSPIRACARRACISAATCAGGSRSTAKSAHAWRNGFAPSVRKSTFCALTGIDKTSHATGTQCAGRPRCVAHGR